MKNKIFSFLLFFAIAMNQLFTIDAQNTLNKEQMQKDFVVLKATLEHLHPGLLKYNTQKQMQRHFDDFAKKINVNTMETKQFYVLLAEFVNKIRCGHTFLNPLNLKDEAIKTLFTNDNLPFYFTIIDNKIIITHNLSEFSDIKAGDEIAAIDGIKSKTIINQLLKVSRSDGNNAIGKKLSNLNLIPEEDYVYALFDIFFPAYFGNKTVRKLLIKHFAAKNNIEGNKKKQEQEYTIACIKQQERSRIYESKFGKIATDKETWTYKMPNSETVLLRFGTFAFWNSDFDYKKHLDSIFTIIENQKNVKNLIIDLRNNEGGSGDIRNEILSYLTSKTLEYESNSKICYRYLTIPDSVKKYLTTWDRSFSQAKNKADFTVNELGLYQKNAEQKEDLIRAKAKSFKGNIFLLVNSVNSSATFSFAWTFQYNKLGTIVGENTGGTKQGLNGGEMFFLTLPNSSIEIDIPIIYYYQKNMPDEGVKPEKVIKITQSDVANGKDSQLDYILEVLKLSVIK